MRAGAFCKDGPLRLIHRCRTVGYFAYFVPNPASYNGPQVMRLRKFNFCLLAATLTASALWNGLTEEPPPRFSHRIWDFHDGLPGQMASLPGNRRSTGYLNTDGEHPLAQYLRQTPRAISWRGQRQIPEPIAAAQAPSPAQPKPKGARVSDPHWSLYIHSGLAERDNDGSLLSLAVHKFFMFFSPSGERRKSNLFS